jgi:predicted murein hydrolase (TIGR00659 family)
MADNHLATVWVYLSTSPLIGLTITLMAYSAGYRLYEVANRNPLLNPVVTAIAVLILFLQITGVSYETYFEGAQFVHFLLGPATVALAVPLYQQCAKIRTRLIPLGITLLVGPVVGAGSSVGIAWMLGASLETQLSLAPKSVTTPVAMGISEQIGGLPSLTAVLVVATGIIGAVMGTTLFRLLRIRDDAIEGAALGIAAHGIGTARAFQLNKEMGAFAGLAMALSALTTAVVVPWLLSVVGLLE